MRLLLMFRDVTFVSKCVILGMVTVLEGGHMRVLGETMHSVSGGVSVDGSIWERWRDGVLEWLYSIVAVDEMGFGSLSMYFVGLSLVMTQQRTVIYTFAAIAATWLRVRVNVFPEATVSISGYRHPQV